MLNLPFNNLALLFQFSKMIDVLFFYSPFLQSLSGIVRFADRSRNNFGRLATAFLFLFPVVVKEKKDKFVVEGWNSGISLGFIVKFNHEENIEKVAGCLVETHEHEQEGSDEEELKVIGQIPDLPYAFIIQ